MSTGHASSPQLAIQVAPFQFLVLALSSQCWDAQLLSVSPLSLPRNLVVLNPITQLLGPVVWTPNLEPDPLYGISKHLKTRAHT